jgi:mannosylglycerate hydrolase
MVAHKPVRAILVSHTHWDRAWYEPFQVFRIRLVRLIDRLLDLLDRDPEFRCFMLDGQMLLLEDYLEIRPGRRADLQRLVGEGRLLVGPWYVLADEYLVSPEALIRNLLLGERLAEELAGSAPPGPGFMREGYVPDAFGHIGQLPQILRGFGIGSAIFSRGAGDEGEELGNEFWWEAPDGSRVLAIHLRSFYFNAANLGYPMYGGDPGAMAFDMDLALDRLRQAVDRLAPHARAGAVLLLNGIDHSEADPNVPHIIARANEAFGDVQIEQGTLSDYVAHVRAVAGDALASFQGEFNRSRYAFGLQGVYSSRMALQQANERAQTLLESYAEPLSTWAWTLGKPYPASFLALAWRKLLQNHPHDDICGCSVDDVHRENMVRFAEAGQIGATLARDAFRSIMRQIDRRDQPGVPFVLFNPTAWSRTATVELDLQFEAGDATAGSFHLVDASGQVVPAQRLAHARQFETEVNLRRYLQTVRAAVSIQDLPPCGYRVYFARPGSPPGPTDLEHPVQVFENGMENRHLRVEIGAGGTLAVLDRQTGRWFRNLGYFLDQADAGDTYDYAPCPDPMPVCSRDQGASVRLVHAGPLQATYEISLDLVLPASLTADRQRRSPEQVPCPIRTLLTLHHDGRWLDLRTTVDNRALDHRLRVCFPTGIQASVAHADGHFDVLARPIELPPGEGWDQPPVPTRHQRYFVDLSNGGVGLAILNRGLPEYEVLRDRSGGEEVGSIAVTLLRCVGYLSRGDGDMPTRPALAGPPLEVPGAQCLGTHTFEYAIAPHSGDWRSIYRDAYSYRAPVYVRRGTEQEGYLPTAEEKAAWGDTWQKPLELGGELPPEASFLAVQPEMVALSAVKRAERGDHLIVRLYNPSSEPLDARLRTLAPIRNAWLVNLNEEVVGALPVRQGQNLALAIAGKEVKTIALELDRPAAKPWPLSPHAPPAAPRT